ncbi:hypothetical protein quinque_011698 [Culex quinquefasciatus]
MEFETSLEAFEALVAVARRLARFVGMDVLANLYRPNALTAMTLVGCLSYIVIGIYSAWFFYPDIYVTLQALAPVGIAFQGAAKLYSGIIYRDFFYGRIKLLEDFHRKHAKNPRNNAVLLSLMKKVHLAFKLLITAYVVAIAGYGLYPLYFYVMYGERTMALTAVLPGVGVESTRGYSVTLGYQLFLLAIAISGISASDTAVLILVSNLAGLVDVYKNDLLELDELMEAEVASSVSCLTLSLFLCYMTNDIPSYAFLLGALFQLLEFCLLGTIFRVKNDEVIIAIYNTKWYLLNNSQRQMLRFMFHSSQNPVELTIGGLALLNIETFVEIMKTIYQFFAMLISFME